MCGHGPRRAAGAGCVGGGAGGTKATRSIRVIGRSRRRRSWFAVSACTSGSSGMRSSVGRQEVLLIQPAASRLGDPAGLLAQGRAILDDAQMWAQLSRSLAVFLTGESAEAFVLPNRLADQVAVGTHFELGQLWRSLSQQQEALALTISADGWRLWHATPETRIAPLEPTGSYAADAGEATKRTSAGRGDDRLAGDPYELYVKRVADAASAELAAVDPGNRLTLFVFGEERLAHLFAGRKVGRRIVGLRGNPDRVGADELDATVRGMLDELNLTDTESELTALGRGRPRQGRARPRRDRADGGQGRRRHVLVRRLLTRPRHPRPVIRRTGVRRRRDGRVHTRRERHPVPGRPTGA